MKKYTDKNLPKSWAVKLTEENKDRILPAINSICKKFWEGIALGEYYGITRCGWTCPLPTTNDFDVILSEESFLEMVTVKNPKPVFKPGDKVDIRTDMEWYRTGHYYIGMSRDGMYVVESIHNHPLKVDEVRPHQEYKPKVGDWVNYKGGKWLVAKTYNNNVLIYNRGGNDCIVLEEDVSPWEGE